MRSQGFRFFTVAVLALLMMIPMTMVGGVIDSRANYSRDTIASVGREWGGSQSIAGPILVIPVQEEVVSRKRRDVTDPVTGQVQRDRTSGEVLYEYYETNVIEARRPVYLFPGDFHVTVKSDSQIRHRGIFEVPVYSAEALMSFDFPTDKAADILENNEELVWDQAELRVILSTNRALRGKAVLRSAGTEMALEPLSDTDGQSSGIFARTGDPRKLSDYTMELGLNGAKTFFIAPVGRDNRIKMTSDWPHPSFVGAFLPDVSKVTDKGFTAQWNIPHLARALPLISREDYSDVARRVTAFGVKYFQPNDFYQKAYRAARYGILFISLTFLVILLLDRTAEKPVHPVQFILIGLVQAVFALLMVAYSEQIGFAAAYLLSSGAVITLLTMFGALALKMGQRTYVLAALLVILYGVLYLILRSADYALLAGSTLAFGALAGTMFLTRNEDWHGPEMKAGGFWKFREKQVNIAQEAAQS